MPCPHPPSSTFLCPLAGLCLSGPVSLSLMAFFWRPEPPLFFCRTGWKSWRVNTPRHSPQPITDGGWWMSTPAYLPLSWENSGLNFILFSRTPQLAHHGNLLVNPPYIALSISLSHLYHLPHRLYALGSFSPGLLPREPQRRCRQCIVIIHNNTLPEPYCESQMK